MPSYDAISAAAGSLLIPGLGQWVQGRRAAAIYFFGDALGTLMLGAFLPEVRVFAWAAAVAIGLWAVVDAFVAGRRLQAADV
jgi:hypothetical protein